VARGWESKSVEEQIEQARTSHGQSTPKLTPEEAAREKKQDSLLLQRTRVLRDLAACREERYRQVLAAGLAHLESELVDLGWNPPQPAGE